MNSPRIDDINPGAMSDPPPLSPAEQEALCEAWEDRMGLSRHPMGEWMVNMLAGRDDDLRRKFGPPGGSVDHDAHVEAHEQYIDGLCADMRAASDDAYSFSSKSIGEPTLDNCPACKGTGEINEFPADDDERLVACPTCGGTGEVYE